MEPAEVRTLLKRDPIWDRPIPSRYISILRKRSVSPRASISWAVPHACSRLGPQDSSSEIAVNISAAAKTRFHFPL